MAKDKRLAAAKASVERLKTYPLDEEVALVKANAKAKLAQSELNFTEVKAPFEGIVDRLEQQLGSLIKEGEVLTTLSDNSVMWVYFNVPEARYLDYMAGPGRDSQSQRIELKLAEGREFKYAGKIGAIEAKFASGAELNC